MLIGYARVSTQDQNLEMQRQALQAAGCNRIFEDTASGKSTARPGLQQALEFARTGDTLVVWKLDRLGRSVKNLVDMVLDLEKRGVQFQSVTDQIVTSTPAGRFFFHLMASLAQMERELIAERTAEGLKVARAAGRIGGRPRAMTSSKLASARKLIDAGSPVREVAENLGVSVPTLYRHMAAI
jgi:DNA invertase Pin-like site-specific DNA recombinase